MKKFLLALPFPGKKIIKLSFIAVLLLAANVDLYAQSIPSNNCNFLTKVGGLASANGAEISAFDPGSKRVFTVAGSIIEFHTLAINGSLTLGGSLPIGFSLPAGTIALPNSVATSNGIIAASYAVVNATTKAQQPGRVTFYTAATGAVLNSVTVGYLPDMITFTPDGMKLLAANEGEANSYNDVMFPSFDPEGSVSIINLSAGVAAASVQTVSFTSFNGQAAALKAAGVRLFAPNATVAQDLEPEYIAISPDGTTAWVTLQENNAFAIVDIASATVTQIIPLGLKDHSKPTVLGVETFEFNNVPSIGTTVAGQSIPLGGFSGLTFEGFATNGNLKFITHTDRGPNGEPAGINRPFGLPNFAPEIVRFELNRGTGQIIITQRIQLKKNATTLLTGLPNISISSNASQPYNDEVPVDLQNNVLALDPLGGDFEGIVVAADGSFWMVDEYRPALYHFDPSGVLIKRYVPAGTAAAASQPAGTYGMEALPAVLAQRRQNRGFEGIAFYNGKLYLFVQSPMRNPASLSNATLNGMKNVRVVEFDPASETTTGQYIYIMDNDPAASATDTRADKIGDAVSLGNGEFLVIERDDDAIDSDPLADIKKKIYRFSLGGATNINALPNVIAGKTADQMSLAELTAAGIAPITKYLHIDLATAGYNTTEKVEGLTIVDRNTIAVINDNDFTIGGLAINTTTGAFSPFPNPDGEKSLLGLITVRNNGFDASDRDLTSSTGKINIQHWPVFGMYQPDAIAQFSIGGQAYYITANEGDSRDIPGYSEEIRVGAAGYVLDPAVFPNAAFLKNNANLGRLQLTNATGNTDADPQFEQIHALGARSFSIWNSDGMRVYDSGDELEQITAALSPALFNSDGTAAGFDSRSDNKGPEPEAVTTGVIDGVTYAFIGLERVGDIMVYDISNPLAPKFIQYINTPEDRGVEGLVFVSSSNSPTGKPLVISSAEVSNTVTVYEVNIPSISVAETSGLVNNDGIICEGASVTLTASGSSPFLWSTGATTASITVSPASNTTYSVTACNLTATKTITVNPVNSCSITAVPNNNIYTGGIVTNLYLGYGPQQLTLNVAAAAAGAPYTYSWSGGILNNYNTANPVFTATMAGSFTFTAQVTNQFGCVSSCSITICVTDIRVPGSKGKVYVCHAPPGNPGNAKTLSLPVNAVAAHLLNQPDSRLGKCGETPCGLFSRNNPDNKIAEIETGFTVTAFPNPTNSYFTLRIFSDKNEAVEIRVMDIQGRSILSKRNAAQGNITFGQDFVSGIYIVEVTQGGYKQILKITKQ